MREIKFRLWDKLGNKIVTPNKNIYLNLLGQVVTDSPENGEIIPFSKDTYELNQSTGLQDVTGKDIYEGDIVDVGKVMQRYCIIEFKNAKFVLKFQDDFEAGSPTDMNIFLERIRVIGNIYENPELLERGRGKDNE